MKLQPVGMRLLVLTLSIAGLTISSTVFAEETRSNEESPEIKKLQERVLVVGDADDERQASGSVNRIDREHLAFQAHTDIHRILTLIPGVNVQEEDGYGLRPNIGFRGSGVERSGNVTLMEDGVLIAPAPYSAPSAYYFPTAGRMEGFEIRKGSGAIRQGPYTNGGVMNMLSTRIPDRFGGSMDVSGGNDNMQVGRFSLGDGRERFGWLVETFQQETDGFKQLDGGGATGFDLEDFVGKFRVTTGQRARRFQALELKLGYTGQEGRETYLGLTDADFDQNPFRRYAASAEDRIDSNHRQFQARYLLRPGARTDITVTAYRNEFFRNWRKLEQVNGIGVSSVLTDPTGFAAELGWLRGDTDSPDDALTVRDNRREYTSQGIDFRLGWDLGAERKHELELGLRYHEDEEDRFQEEDGYRISAGALVQTSSGLGGSQANRVQSASAWAAYVQDTIRLGDWTLTPGLRLESIRLERDDYGVSDPDRLGLDLARRSNEVDVLIPGFGAHWQASPRVGWFAGVHRGFSPPGSAPSDDAEESVNYEAGVRIDSRVAVKAALFLNDYDRLLGDDSIASGGTGSGDRFNGGEAQVHGLELSAGIDLAQGSSGWSVPVRLVYTYTDSEFRQDFVSDYAPWGEVQAGDELPYLAEHRLGLGAGLRRGRVSVNADMNYLSEMRTEAGSGPIPVSLGTDDRWVFDLSAEARIANKLRLFARVRNLTDEVYRVARRPAGSRPGINRTALVGLGVEF